MPQFTGMDALLIRNERAPDTPFVVVTASINEETAVQCIKQGSDDYVTKQHLAALPHAVETSLEKTRLERVEREAGEQIRRAGRQWRTTVDAMRECVALLDADKNIERCNEAFREMVGRPWQEVIGQPCCQLVHELDDPPPNCPAARTSQTLKRETWRTAIHGRWYDIVADPVLDGAGNLTGIVLVLGDITKRKQAEDRRVLHARLLAILNQAQKWELLLNDLLAEIKAFSGFDAVGIRLRKGEDFPYYVQNGFTDEFVRLESHLACQKGGLIERNENGEPVLECTCGLVLSGRTPRDNPLFTKKGSFWSNDTTSLLDLPKEQDPRHEPRNRCIREGYKSVALVPLRAGGDIIGLLQLNDRRPDQLTQDMVEFFEEVGTSIGVAFMRRQSWEAAVEARSQLEMALRSSNVGLWDWRPATGEIFFSAEWKAQIGYTNDELPGTYMDWESRLHPEDKDETLQALQAYFRGEAPDYEVEFRLQHKDGSYRWILMRGEAIRDEAGLAIRMLGCHVDITYRKQIEKALAHERDRAQTYLDIAGVMIIALDREGTVTMVNRRGCDILGAAREDILGKDWFELFVPTACRDEVKTIHQRIVAGDAAVVEYYENPILRSDGKERHIAWHNSTVKDAEGRIIGLLSSGEDITDRLALEAQLRQAQKLEAVGRLAGGVAHDFNNVLTALKGFIGFAREEVESDSQARQDLDEAMVLADRATGLTRQLLAFSRCQTLEPTILDVNDLVSGLLKMLGRLLGEDVEIRFAPAKDLWRVCVDPGQIEQVVMNLALNARDAMPTGGKLTIETANVNLDPEYAALHAGVAPGPHVMLSVSDTGCGMDNVTRDHIFEPFFTTKELGKGTGLGLATVYGIVKQHGGNILVYSKPGKGTTFKVYLLRAGKDAVKTRAAQETALGSGETLLLVEDEESVRSVTRRQLEALGYAILCAANADEAEEVAAGHEGQIDLLLTDVVMPGKTGPELYESLATRHKGLRVLYMSGYTDKAIVDYGVIEEGIPFLQKPFETSALAAKIRQALTG